MAAKIFEELGLSYDASLFIRGLETDAFANKVVLHFLHESGSYDPPALAYFSITLMGCTDLRLEIEGETEVDDRDLWLRGAHDVIDLRLENNELKQLTLFASGFFLVLSYKLMTLSLEEADSFK
jgi:hypothetical protein